VDDGFEATGVRPPPGLLVDDVPRRQVVGHHPPLHAGADDEAQPVEDLAQAMLPLGGSLVHQRQIGDDESPLVVGHVAGVRFAGRDTGFHPPMIPHPQVHDRLEWSVNAEMPVAGDVQGGPDGPIAVRPETPP
jgi:hypothetical protein